MFPASAPRDVTAAEQAALQAATAAASRHHLLYSMALGGTGLRLSELLGETWATSARTGGRSGEGSTLDPATTKGGRKGEASVWPAASTSSMFATLRREPLPDAAQGVGAVLAPVE